MPELDAGEWLCVASGAEPDRSGAQPKASGVIAKCPNRIWIVAAGGVSSLPGTGKRPRVVGFITLIARSRRFRTVITHTMPGNLASAASYTGIMVRVLRPIPFESIRLLVFDLDGTLIDSARDLCNSVNAALAHMSRPPLPDKIIASFVGNGAPMLVRRTLAVEHGIPAEQVDEQEVAMAYSFFLAHYREHKLDFTYAYDGAMESLEALRTMPDGTPRTMAVLTNKPVRPARAICEGLGMGRYFLRIYGGDSFPLKKPDPMGLRTLIEEAGVRPEETLMIGDSKVDVLTARNGGAWSLGCQFGFGPQNLMETPPDVVVDSAFEWTTALNPAKIDLRQ